MALSPTVEYPAWSPLTPTGWSWPAFALGGIWYLRQGMGFKGRGLLLPQVVVVLVGALNGFYVFRQLSFPEAIAPTLVGGLLLWSFFGSYCAASFRGDAYRHWCIENGRTPVVPTQWQWGAFLLTGGWYAAHGMRVKGLWLWLAFFTSAGSIVGIPIAFAIMCYCGANLRAEQYLEKPPAHIGPTPQERWIHQDVIKSLLAVAKTPQKSLRASLVETAVRGLRRQGYTVRMDDQKHEDATVLSLQRGARCLVVRVVQEPSEYLEQIEQLVASLQNDAYKIGLLVVNGSLSRSVREAAARAHVRVLNVHNVEV